MGRMTFIKGIEWDKYYVIGESVTMGKLVGGNNKYYPVSRRLDFFDATQFDRKRDAKAYMEKNYKVAVDRKLVPFEQDAQVKLYINGMTQPERRYLVDKERNGAVVVKGDYLTMFYKEHLTDDTDV